MIEAAVCWACIVGLHDECYVPEMLTTVIDTAEEQGLETMIVCCCARNTTPDASAFVTEHGGVGRPVLDPGEITDNKSTGRRRAAMLYVIMDGMLCEWAFLRNAGGGIEPIIGCNGNTIENSKTGPHAGVRHHGPDKNTIDNEPGNVHRICTFCHNRWHARNNQFYVGERPPADQPWFPTPPEGQELLKHDPITRATEEEIEANEAFWGKQKLQKVDTED